MSETTTQETTAGAQGGETRVRLFVDGDQWCALMGENVQGGHAGFAPTRAEALAELALEIAEVEQTPLGHLLPARHDGRHSPFAAPLSPADPTREEWVVEYDIGDPGDPYWMSAKPQPTRAEAERIRAQLREPTRLVHNAITRTVIEGPAE